jgi:hypothetical protein
VVVDFVRIEEKGRRHCRWDAVRGKRTRVPGPVMAAGRDLPHDLAQYVVEAATSCPNGFWGLLARGATFKSTGRRVTKPGRAVIVRHREDLMASEHLAGRHLMAWKAGDGSPVSTALDRALAQWQRLGQGERLRFEWPSSVGTVESL